MRANGSRMGDLHPLSAAIYFLCVLVVTMFSGNPVITLSGLLGAIALFPFVCDGKTVLKTFGGLGVSILVITAINPFISHNGVTKLFTFLRINVSLESLLYGANFAAIFSAVIIWGACMGSVMKSEKITYLLGRIAPKTAMVLSMSLRFIPLFSEKARKISRSRNVLGLAEGEGKNRLSYAAKTFSALVGWSLENSVETANSMKARGYGRSARGTFFKYAFGFSDVAVLSAALLLTALNAVGQAMGGGFEFYPKITAIPHGTTDIIAYGAFFILAILPAVIEIVWRIKWKFYESKI
ncbi:MAG: energy-coupling factor transporter transmembrane protein EcfT [Clostridia bacterium]|nr:energy-coupling factor transporter transmembrane protein EcfT [Clostridia bacterium]